MAAESRSKKIDALMEQASTALEGTDYFETEHLAEKAMRLARQGNDFGRMARILMPLQEARRQCYQQALDVGTITIVEEPVTEQMDCDPGCYLIEPPMVGADARRLRLLGRERRVPIAVVCREPFTTLKQCPIVAISPGVTIRTKIDPPDDPDEPDLAWFAGAMEALGGWAIETVDPGQAVLKRLDLLLARLDTVPEHEGLHQALEDVCREAEREDADGSAAGSASGGRGRARSKAGG